MSSLAPVKDTPSKTQRLQQIADVIRPYSQSPFVTSNFSIVSSSNSQTEHVIYFAITRWPMWTVAGIFLASSIVPPNPLRPPLMYRLGFGAIFSGAGYVISTGDVYNGTGIATAWSLTYLFLNLRKSLKPPLSGLSLALSGAALASSTLYGAEYFLLQEKDS
ncbi:unnamed protein product [Somion occarium]|uniref:Uncharacterized protein n=1 Tax=Somion occarium TaxID=3059160 RepID=A0ABP1CZ00_9APHY